MKPAEQRAWYQKVGDWIGEQAHNAGQPVMHPGEGLKGAAKGLGNIPGDLWNLVTLGATAQAGGEMMNSTAMQSAFGGGSAADAEASMKPGQQMATNAGCVRADGAAGVQDEQCRAGRRRNFEDSHPIFVSCGGDARSGVQCRKRSDAIRRS